MQPAPYQQIVDNLTNGSVPVPQIKDAGCGAVVPAAGHIVALAFHEKDCNLLWSNPALEDSESVRRRPGEMVGDFGGDRVRIGPELDYFWSGAPDWSSLSNYVVPASIDPGDYRFSGEGQDTVRMGAKVAVKHREQDYVLQVSVERSIQMAPSPVPLDHPLMIDLEFVGIETHHSVRLDPSDERGRLDLWHILQVPIWSHLIMPIDPATPRDATLPLAYGPPGKWHHRGYHITWHFRGDAQTKFGLSASAATGRCAILHSLDADRWCLLVREFPADSNAYYADHPHRIHRNDQVLQAWDGFGFGEMEYRSPALDVGQGPRAMGYSEQLWAFGGNLEAISKIVEHLTGIKPAEVLRLAAGKEQE